MKVLQAVDFFDLDHNRFADLFAGTEFVWEGLGRIKSYLKENLQPNVEEARRG